jgi:thioredoxin 1
MLVVFGLQREVDALGRYEAPSAASLVTSERPRRNGSGKTESEKTMRNRRSFLALVGAASATFAVPARPFELQPYDPAAVQKAIASGKPVVVHGAAWWCLQCHAQTSILDNLKKDAAYDGVSVFRVDYDKQKDVVSKLDCPRATLIAFRDGKEVARMSWETSQEAVLKVFKAAM